jgi:hypothetical protein
MECLPASRISLGPVTIDSGNDLSASSCPCQQTNLTCVFSITFSSFPCQKYICDFGNHCMSSLLPTIYPFRQIIVYPPCCQRSTHSRKSLNILHVANDLHLPANHCISSLLPTIYPFRQIIVYPPCCQRSTPSGKALHTPVLPTFCPFRSDLMSKRERLDRGDGASIASKHPCPWVPL